MLSQQILSELKRHSSQILCARNIGIVAPALQKASDPIQQLFLDKLREYKAKAGPGYKLHEPSPQLQKDLKDDLDKAAKLYGGEGAAAEMTKFPSLKFTDPKIDPINMEQQQ